jgi:acetyltransferase-like isoleucine patch superfamily enzyme
MGYLTEEALIKMGFKRCGKNVKISDKAAIYEPELMEFGDHARVDDFCLLSGKVSIGRNVHVAAFCNLAGGDEGVTIGDYCGVAYGSHIISQTDDYSGRVMNNSTIPAKYTSVTKAEVLIKRHSMIGTACVIFPGVTIEEGTSIGAMSLVTKSTEPWSIYIGIPAKKVKDRSKALLELEKEYLRNEGSN